MCTEALSPGEFFKYLVKCKTLQWEKLNSENINSEKSKLKKVSTVSRKSYTKNN